MENGETAQSGIHSQSANHSNYGAQRGARARWLALAAATVAALCGRPLAAEAQPPEPTVLGFKHFEFTRYGCAPKQFCDPDGSRTVTMRLFYPVHTRSTELVERADDDNDRAYEMCQDPPATYFEARRLDANDNQPGAPNWLAWMICVADEVRLTAIRDAPIAEPDASRQHPVVFFSSGAGIYAHAYDRIVRSLVEAGFAVVTLGHPYLDAVVPYDDGSVVAGVNSYKSATKVKMYAADARAALTELEHLNHSELGGRLRLGRTAGGVGYMGHSIGGAAATLAARDDSRFSAALNMDGTTYLVDPLPLKAINVARGLTTPWMMISSEANWAANYWRALSTHQDMSYGYGFWIAGGNHSDFHDVCVEAPSRDEWLGEKLKRVCSESLDPGEFADIVGVYAGAFFLQHVAGRGAQSRLQLGVSRHPAVRNFHSWRCDSDEERCK